MARTKSEILSSIITAKNDNAFLSTICTSGSKAAFYYNLFALYAEVTGDFEETFDNHEDAVTVIMETKQVMTTYWWQQLCLNFQLGYSLSIDENGNLYYETEDEDSQIVKRAAVLTGSSNGSITLKIATLGSDGTTPEPLATNELGSFQSYIDQAGPCGIVPTIVNENGDEIQIAATIQIDPQILNIDDGSLLTDSSTFPVEDAINSYISSFSDENFGGVFYYSKMLNTILEASGVVNVEITTLNKKSYSEGSFSDVLTLDGKKFIAAAGYVVIESSWVLADYMTYEV